MQIGQKEIIIIYNSKDNSHKEAIAYANILSGHVRQYDVTKTRFTEKMLSDLAHQLHVQLYELIDVEGALFHRLRLSQKNINNRSALALIVEYPELLKTPVLLMHNRTMFIKDKDDIMSLAMA